MEESVSFLNLIGTYLHGASELLYLHVAFVFMSVDCFLFTVMWLSKLVEDRVDFDRRDDPFEGKLWREQVLELDSQTC